MAFGKGWNDGWWRDAWRYDWGKAKGRGRKGELKGESRDGKGDGPEGAVRLAKGELKGESRDGKGDGCEGAVRLAKGELKGESRDGKGDGCEGAVRGQRLHPSTGATKEETPAPRAKDEVFEEIRHVLNANPALQIQFFDARVRQHLHALLGNGGRQRLKAALNMVHTCTMHKTKQDVKNWPAYLLTLLKKFDADVAHQEPSDRRVVAAKIALEAKAAKTQTAPDPWPPSSASTTPEKTELRTTESSDGASAEFELPMFGLESLESDDEPQPARLELKAPRVTAPPPKPRQNDSFDWGFQAHPTHAGHPHSSFFDLDMQELRPDFQGPQGRYSDVWPSVPVPCHNGVAQPHGPPGPRHVPNGVHAVSYGGHRNRPEAARLAQQGVGGTSNFPAQRSEVVAR